MHNNSRECDPLEELRELVGDDLLSVEKSLTGSALSKIELVISIVTYLLSCGGKRLRPCLTLAFCRLLGYSGELALKTAAAIEFIHSATLLHDDVVDDGTFRRTFATAKSIWGNKESILVGDFLLSKAFNWIVETENIQLLDSLSSASVLIAEGEIKQLLNTKNVETSEESYLKIIECKTAALFATACEMGAILAGRHETEAREFGWNLGIAYQIMDDILDYVGLKTGKSVGNDFCSGKVTLPVIICYKEAQDTEEINFWKRCFGDFEQEKGDFEMALSYIEKHAAIEKCLAVARRFSDVSKKQMDKIDGEKETKAHLVRILGFVTEREF